MSRSNCCVRFLCNLLKFPVKHSNSTHTFPSPLAHSKKKVVEENSTLNNNYLYELSGYVGFSAINAILSAHCGLEVYSRMALNVCIAPLDEISKANNFPNRYARLLKGIGS